jgi:hypothetical protein
MATISNLNVEVGDTETDLIESTETSTNEDRAFGVGNGAKEIIATIWGSDNNEDWNEEDVRPMPPNIYDTLILGAHHYPYVKLTARTTSSGETSIVDAYLTYAFST